MIFQNGGRPPYWIFKIQFLTAEAVKGIILQNFVKKILGKNLLCPGHGTPQANSGTVPGNP